ncbi:MAG: sulfur carrier protein ThiS [Rhizomicrobium sp.]
MKITVNGEVREAAASALTLSALLKDCGVEDIAAVSVQHNGGFVDAAQYETVALVDGDAVEFLYFLGGGAV